MNPLAVVLLFLVTATAEILGCYLVHLWMRGASAALLVPAACALCLFAWLLSVHPTAARAYASYGGVYVATAVAWGWLVEHKTPDRWDVVGATVSITGMAIIAFAPRGAS